MNGFSVHPASSSPSRKLSTAPNNSMEPSSQVLLRGWRRVGGSPPAPAEAGSNLIDASLTIK